MRTIYRGPDFEFSFQDPVIWEQLHEPSEGYTRKTAFMLMKTPDGFVVKENREPISRLGCSEPKDYVLKSIDETEATLEMIDIISKRHERYGALGWPIKADELREKLKETLL